MSSPEKPSDSSESASPSLQDAVSELFAKEAARREKFKERIEVLRRQGLPEEAIWEHPLVQHALVKEQGRLEVLSDLGAKSLQESLDNDLASLQDEQSRGTNDS